MAGPGERVLQVVLLLVAVIAGALILFSDPTAVTQRGRRLSGAIVAMAVIAFVPNRRWRMGLTVAAIGMLTLEFITG